MLRAKREYIPFILAGISLACASIFPETWPGLGFAVSTAVMLAAYSPVTTHLLKAYFVCGFVFTALAFYWLPSTMELFGGMPLAAAWLVHALFSATSALQFVLAAWLLRNLKGSAFERRGLALAASWMCAEMIFPRIFPWAIGHAMIIWSDIAGLSEFWGVPPMGALIMIWGTCIVRLCDRSESRLKSLRWSMAVIVFTMLAAGFGHVRNTLVGKQIDSAPRLMLGTVQGNLSVKQKGDVRYFDANMNEYIQGTASAVAAGAEIVIWPETVVTQWIPETITSLQDARVAVLRNLKAPILFGTLSYNERSPEELTMLTEAHPEFRDPRALELIRYRRYNSAIGADAQGAVVGRYHKRVLMPFGEYVPLSETFPSLKLMLPQTGDFTPGRLDAPLMFTLAHGATGKPTQVRIMPLICYEDLIPELSREAVLHGANLLVNLTNDAWYGDTKAPYQHHLLAQWRAVETRRYFLRATNTGFTALVDPYGRTAYSLPTFDHGYFAKEVSLLDGVTLYARIGDLPAWIICAAVAFLSLSAKIAQRRNKSAK